MRKTLSEVLTEKGLPIKAKSRELHSRYIPHETITNLLKYNVYKVFNKM